MKNIFSYIWGKDKIMPGYFFVVLMLIPNTEAFAQTDSIWFMNGDVLNGEIKSMEEGILQVETSYSDDDFMISWGEVARIMSAEQFMITLSDGRRVNGSIFPYAEDPSKAVIRTVEGDIVCTYLDMVYIKGVNTDFLGRLDASIDLGLTLTKANNLRQYSSRSYIGYVADAWSLSSNYNMVRSVQDSVAPTTRTDADIDFKLFLKKDWFINLSSTFLQNEEMDLDLRSNVKLGLGNYIINNYKMNFGLSGGVAFLSEKYYTATEPDRNSGEAYVGLDLNMFNTGDLNVLSKLYTYPSFTESGRVRMDFNIDFKYDLPLDFYIKVGYTYNFDNKPTADASKTDYILQTSFGWEL